MSAYIITKQAMDVVVETAFSHWHIANQVYLLFGAEEPERPETETLLGKALFELNGIAVDSRYGTVASGAVQAKAYEFKKPRGVSVAQAQTCITNLVYQCAEGDVPETEPLFRHLCLIGIMLASRLFMDSAESNACKWDYRG